MRLRRFPKKNFWKLLKFTFTQHIMTLKMHLDANRALAQGPSGTVKWRERGWFWTQTQSSYLWWDWYGQHAICNEGVGWERPCQGSGMYFRRSPQQHFWRFCINIFEDSASTFLTILQPYISCSFIVFHATNATMSLLGQTLWGDIWKYTVGKNPKYHQRWR